MEMQLSYLFAQGIGILILLSIIGGLLYGIFCLGRLLLKLRKCNQPIIIKYYILMIMCILIVAASWVLNMGWLRVILTWLAFPIIHSVIFAIINGKALLRLFCSSKLRIYTLISYVSYVFSHIFFPDFADIGPMYVFFRLLRDNTIACISGIFSVMSFVIYIIFTVFQLIEISRIKRTL